MGAHGRWRFLGGAGTPPLAVTSADGTTGVLKIAELGRLDAAARVMLSADGRGYARVLAWDADRGALLTERSGGNPVDSRPRRWTSKGRSSSPSFATPGACRSTAARPLTARQPGSWTILADLGPRYGSDYPQAIARAIRHAQELAAFERPEVVCHGDPHSGQRAAQRLGLGADRP